MFASFISSHCINPGWFGRLYEKHCNLSQGKQFLVNNFYFIYFQSYFNIILCSFINIYLINIISMK